MDHCVAIADQTLAVGELSHFAGFNHQGTSSEVCLIALKIFKHMLYSFLPHTGGF